MNRRWAMLAVIFLTRLSMGDQFQYYLGVAVAQPIAGWLRDVTGNPAMPVFFAAAVMVATVAFLGAFRGVHRAWGAAWGGVR